MAVTDVMTYQIRSMTITHVMTYQYPAFGRDLFLYLSVCNILVFNIYIADKYKNKSLPRTGLGSLHFIG